MIAIVNVPWVHKEKASSSYEGALYAALDCIQQGNPELAQQIHDDKAPPPFSAMLENGVLRVGVLSREVFLAMNRSKLAHKAEMVAATTLADLWAEAEERAPRRLKLEFVTPVSFAREGMMHVLPEPALLFGSLQRRWEDVSREKFVPVNLSKVVVGECNLRSQRVTASKYVAYGATGRMTLTVQADTAVALYALVRFGEYAGVGQRTTQGFGQLRVLGAQ